MDDKYLDNVFREKLELPQQHDFDESAWLDLESRLEDKQKRRFILPWRWIAAAGIILPMLMMSVYFYYELRQTEQQLAKLETKMNKLLNKKDAKVNDNIDDEKSLAMNDNLVENAIVLRQSATRPKSIESVVKESPSTNLSSEFSTSKKVTTHTVQPENNTAVVENNKKDVATKTYQEAIINEEKEVELASTLTPSIKAANDLRAENAITLNSKNKVVANGFKYKKAVPNLNYLNSIHSDNAFYSQESFLEKTTAFVRPTGFEVSAVGFLGIQIPESNFLKTIQDEKPILKSRGIEVAANFINGVDLTLGANFTEFSYITTTVPQDFPIQEPDNPRDILNDITITEDIFQIPVGLRYNFGDYDDVFVPFIEAGGIAKRSIRTEHSFNYSPASRGDEPYKIKKPQKATGNDANFAMNTLFASVGFKINPKMKNRILDNVSIQSEVFINRKNDETPESMWSAGIGVGATYSL